MQDVSVGEIDRKLERHISDSTKNNVKQNDMLETILAQVTKTNGRVLRLEEKSTEDKILLEKHANSISHFKGRESWIIGCFGVILLFGGFFFNALWQNLEYKVDYKINDKFVNYENNKNK